jgi:hypothetical protein
MMAGQNVTKASRPKPIGFGLGSFENSVTANKGVTPIASSISPAQNSLLILTAIHLSPGVVACGSRLPRSIAQRVKSTALLTNQNPAFHPHLAGRVCSFLY